MIEKKLNKMKNLTTSTICITPVGPYRQVVDLVVLMPLLLRCVSYGYNKCVYIRIAIDVNLKLNEPWWAKSDHRSQKLNIRSYNDFVIKTDTHNFQTNFYNQSRYNQHIMVLFTVRFSSISIKFSRKTFVVVNTACIFWTYYLLLNVLLMWEPTNGIDLSFDEPRHLHFLSFSLFLFSLQPSISTSSSLIKYENPFDKANYMLTIILLTTATTKR